MNADDDNERLTQLKFMICEPIVSKAKPIESDQSKLIELVKDAQARSKALAKDTKVLDAKWKSEFYRDLALRIYIRFKMNEWDKSLTNGLLSEFDSVYSVRNGKIAEALAKLKKDSWLCTDDGLSLGDMEYASKLKYEVIELIVFD